MHCPYCHCAVVRGKDKRFETLCEHVEDPNREEYPLRPTWVCENLKCALSKEQVFWDDRGSMYGWSDALSCRDFHSTYPSFERRMEVEIQRRGVKDKIYLPAALMLWILKPIIEFEYKADEWGHVLEKTWKLKWLKKDSWKPWKKDPFGYHTYYTFPIMNIIHSLKSTHRDVEYFKYHPESAFAFNNLKDEFKPIPSWDKRWWRHAQLWVSKIIFRKWYLKFK